MAITTALIKELRERTGAGMLDCKKALQENGGDIEKAIDWLREKGIAKAAKKSGRVAAEGLVFAAVSEDRKKGAILEFNSETDFVAKNDEFKSFGEKLVDLTLNHDLTSEDELKAIEFEGKTVETHLTELIAKIGENMNIRRLKVISTDGFIETYIHLGGKIGVLLDVNGEATPENVEKARGTIDSVTVSVILNKDTLEGGELTDEKRTQIVNLITTATGLDTKAVEVFAESFNKADDLSAKNTQGSIPMWQWIAIAVIALIPLILLTVTMLRRARAKKKADETKKTENGPIWKQEEIEAIEIGMKESGKKKSIEDLIEKNPEIVTQLLKTWIEEE